MMNQLGFLFSYIHSQNIYFCLKIFVHGNSWISDMPLRTVSGSCMTLFVVHAVHKQTNRSSVSAVKFSVRFLDKYIICCWWKGFTLYYWTWCCNAGWSGLVQAVFLTAGLTLLCFCALGLFFPYYFFKKDLSSLTPILLTVTKFYFWMFWLNEIRAHHVSWPALNGILSKIFIWPFSVCTVKKLYTASIDLNVKS